MRRLLLAATIFFFFTLPAAAQTLSGGLANFQIDKVNNTGGYLGYIHNLREGGLDGWLDFSHDHGVSAVQTGISHPIVFGFSARAGVTYPFSGMSNEPEILFIYGLQHRLEIKANKGIISSIDYSNKVISHKLGLYFSW